MPFVDGWWQGRIAVTLGEQLCLVDPVNGEWKSLAATNVGTYVSDGRSLAGGGDDRSLAVVDVTGREILVPLGPWASGWSDWGREVAPAADGGFVLVLVPQLVRISENAVVSVDPLPAGYVTVATTSKEDWFILRKDDREAPEAMQGPFTAYLWTPSISDPTPIMGNVIGARPSSTGLAWLETISGRWDPLDVDGKVDLSLTPPPGSAYDLSPAGNELIERVGVADGCGDVSQGRCETHLLDVATHGRIAACSCIAGSVRWTAGNAAFMTKANNGATVVVVLTSRGQQLELAMP